MNFFHELQAKYYQSLGLLLIPYLLYGIDNFINYKAIIKFYLVKVFFLYSTIRRK